MQIYTDVCGLPIYLTEIPEASLLGGAILAATGLGAYPDMQSTARAMVKVTRTFVLDSNRHEAYRFYYNNYKQTYI